MTALPLTSHQDLTTLVILAWIAALVVIVGAAVIHGMLNRMEKMLKAHRQAMDAFQEDEE